MAYAFTTVAGILYATTRALVFHRPERQVAVELFVLVLILNSAAVALNYLRRRESFLLNATDNGAATERQGRRLALAKITSLLSYRLSAKVRYRGLAACLNFFYAPKIGGFKSLTAQGNIINGEAGT